MAALRRLLSGAGRTIVRAQPFAMAGLTVADVASGYEKARRHGNNRDRSGAGTVVAGAGIYLAGFGTEVGGRIARRSESVFNGKGGGGAGDRPGGTGLPRQSRQDGRLPVPNLPVRPKPAAKRSSTATGSGTSSTGRSGEVISYTTKDDRSVRATRAQIARWRSQRKG